MESDNSINSNNKKICIVRTGPTEKSDSNNNEYPEWISGGTQSKYGTEYR